MWATAVCQVAKRREQSVLGQENGIGQDKINYKDKDK
jgi:hypothetical protein